MNKEQLLKRVLQLCSAILFFYFLFKIHQYLSPRLMQFEDDCSAIEINIISNLIFSIVTIQAIIFYYTYHKFKDKLWWPKKSILVSINKAQSLLMRAQPKWGLTINSEEVKIANVAEALFFPTYFPDYVTPISLLSYKRGIDILINDITGFGLKSFSFQQHTVQCSSLGLYVLANMSGSDLINKDQLTKIQTLYDSLIISASEYGWGTLNKPIKDQSELRFTTSFWALRAINAYKKDDMPDKAKTALRSIIEFQSDGRFGFKPGDRPKLTSVCLFLLLLHELKNTSFKKSIIDSVPIKCLIGYAKEILNKVPSIQTGGVLSEIEEYSTIKIEGISPVERLSYAHVAGIYAISVLICYKEYLNIYERGKLRLYVHTIMYNFNKEESIGIDIQGLQQQLTNPLIFPIAYFLEMINNYRKEYNL